MSLSYLLAKARSDELDCAVAKRYTHQALPHVRIRDRVAARLRAHHLDQTLARGTAPSTEPALAWRAWILTRPANRVSLANQLRALLSPANWSVDSSAGSLPNLEFSIGASHARVYPRRAAVLEANAELEALADRLLAPGAVDPQGVAQVRLMLTDGTGPLYWHAAPESLRTVSRRALDNLHPTPQPAA